LSLIWAFWFIKMQNFFNSVYLSHKYDYKTFYVFKIRLLNINNMRSYLGLNAW
jgi:hypothetical protein